MSQSADSIIAYIELLHSNRHLIASAYCNGGVGLNEDNQRRVRQLQQHRVLIPYIQDEFRLSPSLSRHMDEVFQRQRSYAVGANFGELINRLPQLIDEFISASHDNRQDDQDMYAADFDVGVFELATLVSTELLGLRVITENQFANVRTVAEKQRQNDFYLKRAQTIGHALSLLENEALLELLGDSALLKPLNIVYQHQILIKMQEWRATHRDITSVLKAFHYRFREIEPEARRLRAFAHFLRKNPDYQIPDQNILQSLPDWASRFAGISLKAHPDISVSNTREELAEIAQAIPAAKVTIVKERPAGRMLDGAQDSRVVIIQPKPVQIAFHRYIDFSEHAVVPVSAIAWKRSQQEFESLDDEAWLLYVIHSTQMTGVGLYARLRKLHIRRVEAPGRHPRSGNIVITDIELWKKT